MTHDAMCDFPKVKDISEWQKLCSCYRFHSEEEYKLDWWFSVIDWICTNNDSFLVNIKDVRKTCQKQFKEWPIEILCLPNIFRALVNKRKIVELDLVLNKMELIWEEASKAQLGSYIQRSNSKLKWLGSLFGKLYSNFDEDISCVSISETPIENENTQFICISMIKRKFCKFFQDLNDGIIGVISSVSVDEQITISKSRLVDYVSKNYEMIQEIPCSNIVDIIIWYMMIFSPQQWVAKPFTTCSPISKTNIHAVKFQKISTARQVLKWSEVSISESDQAEILLITTEENLNRTLTNLEGKYLFHDKKCREYALADQKQLAINHLKQKHNIEKALNDINEQLLVLSNSKVIRDSSTVKMSVLSALESSSNATKLSLDENEALKKVENIAEVQDELQNLQRSIDSLVKTCISDDIDRASEDTELEKELDTLLTKVYIENKLEKSTMKFMGNEADKSNTSNTKPQDKISKYEATESFIPLNS
ncbi:hypothetical protein cand_023730 [Cryptosporidium andersoni]|uniref:Charged multivesicular body protein 7 n=1 Tax=Cryptosporidium andersoni TaxID=117008 RepID=A0A1J4MS78_9CRYT|nr:hypothetical protein cand_023730 [Cryptosporidium andersoni]